MFAIVVVFIIKLTHVRTKKSFHAKDNAQKWKMMTPRSGDRQTFSFCTVFPCQGLQDSLLKIHINKWLNFIEI